MTSAIVTRVDIPKLRPEIQTYSMRVFMCAIHQLPLREFQSSLWSLVASVPKIPFLRPISISYLDPF
jgi:hypothetical protein